MTVTTADLGAARVITWDRQDRRNAWDLPTMTAIAAEIEVAGRDADVRMVAVRGAGGHFSAGDDLQAAIEADSAAWAETIEGVPADDARGPGRTRAGGGRGGRRVRGRRARVRGEL